MVVRSVLFVCLGNVNRSPTAEYILRKKLNLPKGTPSSFLIESAATGGHTEGDPAMREMILAARKRGVDLTPHRARQVRQRGKSEAQEALFTSLLSITDLDLGIACSV